LVKKTKPGFVKVYDYYDPGKDWFYSIEETWFQLQPNALF
jgi:hypothetical protein